MSLVSLARNKSNEFTNWENRLMFELLCEIMIIFKFPFETGIFFFESKVAIQWKTSRGVLTSEAQLNTTWVSDSNHTDV